MSLTDSSLLQIAVEPLSPPVVGSYGTDYPLYMRHYAEYVKACASYQADKHIVLKRVRSKRNTPFGFTKRVVQEKVIESPTDDDSKTEEPVTHSKAPHTLVLNDVQPESSRFRAAAPAAKTVPKPKEAAPPDTNVIEYTDDDISDEQILTLGRIANRGTAFVKCYADVAQQKRAFTEGGGSQSEWDRARACPSFKTRNVHFTSLVLEFYRGSGTSSKRKFWRAQVATWRANATAAGLAVTSIP